MPAPGRICLAKIGAAHGVRGLVKLNIFAGDPLSLNSHKKFFTGETGDDSMALRVKTMVSKSWVAEVEGVRDRNAAETLRGKELWLDRAQLPTLEQAGEYYVADLIGLQVSEANGQLVGRIIAVDNFGAGDLLEIQPAEGAAFYLPFTAEILRGVDLAAGAMTVELPAGLHD